MAEIGVDLERGREAAKMLLEAFATTGIHGRTDMPEDTLPAGITKGSREHVLFITLTVAIDYQRDAAQLWESSRQSYEDQETHYLFDPRALSETEPSAVQRDMQRHALSQKPRKDAGIWRTVGVTFHKKWADDPRRFLSDCGWNAPLVLSRLKGDSHLAHARPVADYPYLRGPKIGPLWLRMLRDNVGITHLANLNRVPIPVDIHVARATLCLGVVRGEFEGPLEELFSHVRQAWADSVGGLVLRGRSVVALDLDEPLWHLSKYGCRHRNPSTGTCRLQRRCELAAFCVKGKVKIADTRIELRT